MTERFQGDQRQICWQTQGRVGISSTPAIDPAGNAMYLVYRTSSPFSQAKYDARQYLRKIDLRDLTTIAEKEISTSQPGFDPNKVLNRTGLLLGADGAIYVGFGAAVCDNGGGDPDNPVDPHGWIMAFDSGDLHLIAARNMTPGSPNSLLGGVWQSGNGLAEDKNGFIYALTGNNQAKDASTIDLSKELSDAIVRLRLRRQNHSFDESHYTAPDWLRIDAGDADLGSGGLVVLRNGAVVGGGKPGKLYVMSPSVAGDSNSPFEPKQSFQAFYNSWHSGISPCDYDLDQAYGPNIHGSPAMWHPDATDYSLLYEMPEKDYLKAFRAYDDGHVEERPFLSTLDSGIRSPRGMPGGFASVSADGGKNGIVWVTSALQDGVNAVNTDGSSRFDSRLLAFDGLSLKKLWESPEHVPLAKFVPPTIAMGLVFRPSNPADQGRILVYGSKANRVRPGKKPHLAAIRPVTALWRDSDHLDLFMTSRDSTDGSVLSTNWEATCLDPSLKRGWKGWFPVHSLMDSKSDDENLPSGFTFLASPASPVTAVWRDDRKHLDLFVAAKDGKVMSIVWEPPPASKPPTSGWQGWFEIHSRSGQTAPRVAPGQTITALRRPRKSPADPSHLDLFVTDTNGTVWSTYFENPTSGWADWFVVRSASGQVPPRAAKGQPVTAVWRPSKGPGDPRHLDLFMTDQNGVIRSTYFDEAHPPWADWFEVRSASGQVPPHAAEGQAITALWRPFGRQTDARHLDLFLTDDKGIVRSTYFDDMHPGWVDWFVVQSVSGKLPPPVAPGQPVTAVWSSSGHLDLFMTAEDGRIMTIFFDNNQWRPEGWFAL